MALALPCLLMRRNTLCPRTTACARGRCSIPGNAYQNYRYGNTSKVPDFEIKESLKLRFKEIDDVASEPGMSLANADALKKANIRYMDLLSHDSTVILLHEKGV